MDRVLRTFVCHGSQTLELHEGEALVAGRSGQCDLVLDDDLASRAHCRLELVGGRVFVEDLGSRNGLLVNGLKAERRQELHHGDQVTAGRSALTVLRQRRTPRTRTSSSQFPPMIEDEEDSQQVTGAGNLVELLTGSARRALEEDDLMVAERTTLNLFGLLRRASRGRALSGGELDGAARLGLDLAERTSDPTWLARLLELHVASERVVPAAVGPRFVELVERLGAPRRGVAEYRELAAARGDSGAVARLCERLQG